MSDSMSKEQEALNLVRQLKTQMYSDFVYSVATKCSMIQLESNIDNNLDTLQSLITKHEKLREYLNVKIDRKFISPEITHGYTQCVKEILNYLDKREQNEI